MTQCRQQSAHIPEQSVQPRHATQQHVDHGHIPWLQIKHREHHNSHKTFQIIKLKQILERRCAGSCQAQHDLDLINYTWITKSYRGWGQGILEPLVHVSVSVCVCVSGFCLNNICWTTEAAVTYLGTVVYHPGVECHAESLVCCTYSSCRTFGCCLQGQKDSSQWS